MQKNTNYKEKKCQKMFKLVIINYFFLLYDSGKSLHDRNYLSCS